MKSEFGMQNEWSDALIKLLRMEKRIHNDGLAHGTKVLKGLVDPWARSDQIIFAQLYFFLVAAANSCSQSSCVSLEL